MVQCTGWPRRLEQRVDQWKKLPFSNCTFLPASPCSFAVPLYSSMELVSFRFKPFEAANTDDTFARADFHTIGKIIEGAIDNWKSEEIFFS
mmetsp:Transcript_4068/g.25550  ORF Transcript_4068/g.25550 Transcript_4068/m.25550 type:complete len:91 (-) Transcript_4068:1894-2166(-)